MNVKSLERCFKERIDNKMGNFVDAVEDRIQNSILTAIESIIATKIESAVRSKNASPGRDATSVTAISEREKRLGNTASFENVSDRNNTLHVLNTNDETRNIIPDEVNELSVPETHFNREPYTHHNCFLTNMLDGVGLPVGLHGPPSNSSLRCFLHRQMADKVQNFLRHKTEFTRILNKTIASAGNCNIPHVV